jgi:hypothetical protein
MSLENRAEWGQLLEENDPGRQVYLGLQLADRLDANEVFQIASLFSDSSDQQLRYLASGVLLHLYRKNNPKFSPELRSKVQATAEHLVKTEYPHTSLGQRAFVILRLGDSARAERFLLSEINPTQLEALALRSYISDLEFGRSDSAVEKLRFLEAMGGEIGRLAHQSLENMGKLSRSQLETLASQFKSERSSVLLYKLFHVFLRFQIGKPVQVVRELLGEPTSLGKLEGTDCLIYRTSESHGEVKILYKDGLITDTVSDE